MIDRLSFFQHKALKTLFYFLQSSGSIRCDTVLWQDLIDVAECVQGAREADIGQTHGESSQQDSLPVAHGSISAHMSLHLGFAPALGAEDNKGQHLSVYN